MENFTPLEVDADLLTEIDFATKAFDTNRERLLEFNPPENGPGKTKMKEILRSLYTYESEDTRLYHKNKSPVCGLEYWYTNEEFEYVMYAPSKQMESLIRRQMVSHFIKGNIELRKPFIFDINSDDYIVGGRMKLRNHYFEPIKNFDSPTQFEVNPFQSIFGELDTKDGMRVIIQVLFKPAESDWPHLNTKNVEEYADKKRNESRKESTWFGLRTQTREPSQAKKREADLIENQVNSLGFYVNVRFFLVHHDKQTIQDIASELSNIIGISFESSLGQTLEPTNHQDEQDVRDEFIDTILRRPIKMRQPKRPLEYLHSTKIPGSETMIMTIPELATLTQIPTKTDVPIESIRWNDKPVGGTIPKESTFKGLAPSEQQKIEEKRKQTSMTVTDQQGETTNKQEDTTENSTTDMETEHTDKDSNSNSTSKSDTTAETKPSDASSDINELLDSTEGSSDSTEDSTEPEADSVTDQVDAELSKAEETEDTDSEEDESAEDPVSDIDDLLDVD